MKIFNFDFVFFTLSGNLHLSNFIFEMRVVRWSIPLEVMDCIAGYEYLLPRTRSASGVK